MAPRAAQNRGRIRDGRYPVDQQLLSGVGVALEHGLLTPILERANLALDFLYVHGLAVAEWAGARDDSAGELR